jgi:hypothetical protein
MPTGSAPKTDTVYLLESKPAYGEKVLVIKSYQSNKRDELLRSNIIYKKGETYKAFAGNVDIAATPEFHPLWWALEAKANPSDDTLSTPVSTSAKPMLHPSNYLSVLDTIITELKKQPTEITLAITGHLTEIKEILSGARKDAYISEAIDHITNWFQALCTEQQSWLEPEEKTKVQWNTTFSLLKNFPLDKQIEIITDVFGQIEEKDSELNQIINRGIETFLSQPVGADRLKRDLRDAEQFNASRFHLTLEALLLRMATEYGAVIYAGRHPEVMKEMFALFKSQRTSENPSISAWAEPRDLITLEDLNIAQLLFKKLTEMGKGNEGAQVDLEMYKSSYTASMERRNTPAEILNNFHRISQKYNSIIKTQPQKKPASLVGGTQPRLMLKQPSIEPSSAADSQVQPQEEARVPVLSFVPQIQYYALFAPTGSPPSSPPSSPPEKRSHSAPTTPASQTKKKEQHLSIFVRQTTESSEESRLQFPTRVAHIDFNPP